MTPYTVGRLGTTSKLHYKVIHGPDYTDAEYLHEDRKIRRLSNNELILVCPACFPLLNQPKFPSRPVETFALGYPKIVKIVEAADYNQPV